MNDVQANNYTDTNALEKRVRLNNENFRLYFVNAIKAAIVLTLFFVQYRPTLAYIILLVLGQNYTLNCY